MLQFGVGIVRNLWNEGIRFSHFNLCQLSIKGTNKAIFLRRHEKISLCYRTSYILILLFFKASDKSKILLKLSFFFFLKASCVK